MHYALMSNDAGITKFSYSQSSNAFVQVAEYPIETRFGDFTISPDGILYVSDFSAGIVLRYDADGDFIDQFMDEYVYDFEWIEGKLIGLTGDSRVVEINKLDGSIIDTLIDANSYEGPGTVEFFGMAAFSVPEPSAMCLMIGLGIAAGFRPLSRKRR